MDIRELKYFLAVARNQNLTKAAEELYITQPSLTRQIQNLEKEIGAPLFLRTGRKMILTESGLLLQKRAEEIISLLEKTQAELHPKSDIGGEICIGGGETYAFTSVIAAMREIRETYPEISFNIYSCNTEDVKEKLDGGLIDFGIIVEPCDLSRYDFLRLPFADTWGILMRKDNPLAAKKSVTVEDIVDEPMLVSRHFNSEDNELNRIKRRLNCVSTYNLIYNASLMVKEGIGSCLCIDRLINTEGSDLCFVPLEPKTVSFIDIAWKKNQVFTAASKVFLQALQRHIIHFEDSLQ